MHTSVFGMPILATNDEEDVLPRPYNPAPRVVAQRTQQQHRKIVDSGFLCWGRRRSEIHHTKELINTVIRCVVRICSRQNSWVDGGRLGEVFRAEEGGSILIFDRDVVRCELIPRPIATRLGFADEPCHYANNEMLRAETRTLKLCSQSGYLNVRISLIFNFSNRNFCGAIRTLLPLLAISTPQAPTRVFKPLIFREKYWHTREN